MSSTAHSDDDSGLTIGYQLNCIEGDLSCGGQ